LAVLGELQSYRRSLLRTEARVLADEPRLRALLATDDISTATIREIAFDIKSAVAAELFVLADEDGTLLVDTADPEATGHDLNSKPLVAEALVGGESSGTWMMNEALYQVQAQRIEFDDQVMGVAVIGYRLDRRIAEAIYRLTASSIIIEYRGRVAILSSFEGRVSGDMKEMA
ncbi:MAG: hypothetical protein GY773_14485, partial [Actinomycetia bacterium]|nr:hypothetical protein [Actinomycetes bacterium]